MWKAVGNSSLVLKRENWSGDKNLVRSYLCGSNGKESACNVGDQVCSLCWEDPLEKEMTNDSSILAWRIPWTEEPGGLRSMGKGVHVEVRISRKDLPRKGSRS